MITLEKWFISYSGIGGYLANGIVYGHTSPYCPDGEQIHTSIIESVEVNGDEILLYTRNSEYHLPFDEISCDCYAPMSSMRVFERFALEFGLSDVLGRVRERYLDMDRELMRFQQEIYDKLPDNSLYLELSDREHYYFNLGLYRGEGGHREFITCISDYYSEMGRNTASLDDLVEFCPYIGGNIKFIRHSIESLTDNEMLGVIRNVGEKALNIRFSWGKTVIAAPDSEVTVISGMGVDIPLTETKQFPEDDFDF